MADLAFSPKHNICAILDVDHPDAADFIEAIKFLKRSSLVHALTANPLIYASYIKEFWANASIVEKHGIESIQSTIHDNSIVITEAVVRRVLGFHDDLGEDTLELDDVHGVFRRMGYEGVFPKKTLVRKANVSYQWRFLIHSFIHCLSARKGGFDEMNFGLSSGLAALVTYRRFNFSGFIFSNLKQNLEDSKNKFLLYPRFLQMLIDSEVKGGLMREGDFLKLQHLNWKVFKRMKRNHHRSTFSRVYTPLFPNMIQIQEDQPVAQGQNVQNEVHGNGEEMIVVENVNDDVDVRMVEFEVTNKGGNEDDVHNDDIGQEDGGNTSLVQLIVPQVDEEPNVSSQNKESVSPLKVYSSRTKGLTSLSYEAQIVSLNVRIENLRDIIKAQQGEISDWKKDYDNDATKLRGVLNLNEEELEKGRMKSLGLTKRQAQLWFASKRLKDKRKRTACGKHMMDDESDRGSPSRSRSGSGSSFGSGSESDSSRSNEPLEAADTPDQTVSRQPLTQTISHTEIESRIEKEVMTGVDSLLVEMDEKIEVVNVNSRKDVFESCRQELIDRCVGGSGCGGCDYGVGVGDVGGDGDVKNKMINMLIERNKRDKAKYESLLNEIACLGKSIEATDKLIDDIKQIC